MKDLKVTKLQNARSQQVDCSMDEQFTQQRNVHESPNDYAVNKRNERNED